MLLARDYDKENHLDRAWYNSSNVIYSECDDTPGQLKTLRVTFKNGASYMYEKVEVQDYVMFMRGGTDGSNGKALNKYIKPKYDCVRLDDADLDEIQNSLDEYLMKKKEENEAKKEKTDTESETQGTSENI